MEAVSDLVRCANGHEYPITVIYPNEVIAAIAPCPACGFRLMWKRKKSTIPLDKKEVST